MLGVGRCGECSVGQGLVWLHSMFAVGVLPMESVERAQESTKKGWQLQRLVEWAAGGLDD